MYVYIYIYTHTLTHMCICVHIYIYIYIYIRARAHGELLCIHKHYMLCIVALIAQWFGCQPQEAEVLGSILTTSN